jgi:hypothetical protein
VKLYKEAKLEVTEKYFTLAIQHFYQVDHFRGIYEVIRSIRDLSVRIIQTEDRSTFLSNEKLVEDFLKFK